MANDEHLAILRQGVDAWNGWRKANPDVHPDLSSASLPRARLAFVDLSFTNLGYVDLDASDLIAANLSGSNLGGANLRSATLVGTHLRSTGLRSANFSSSYLNGADISDSVVVGTIFADVDLSRVRGLDTVRHGGPSSLGMDTLVKSKGKIPEIFLRGCGVPDSVIEYLPSLIGAMEPIQFYSCFISYSSEDGEFAKRLHGRMQQEHLRVWFAPEDMKAGEKLYEQIDRAIQLQDRLLLVLSHDSINSKWVETEIRRARRAEIRESRRKLFPIRLVSFE